MKNCRICFESKEEEKFRLRKDCKSRRNECLTCEIVIKKERYHRDTESRNKRLEWLRQYKALNKNQSYIKIAEYLRNHPCVDCGFSDIRALQFDHVRGLKNKSIAELISRSTKWTKIEEEIAKCEVRCANCHQIKTSLQLGYKNAKFIIEG